MPWRHITHRPNLDNVDFPKDVTGTCIDCGKRFWENRCERLEMFASTSKGIQCKTTKLTTTTTTSVGNLEGSKDTEKIKSPGSQENLVLVLALPQVILT